MSESSVLSPVPARSRHLVTVFKGVEKQIQGRESPKQSFERKTLGLEKEKNHCVNEAD